MVTDLDYMLLVLGARDSNYLINVNRNTLDNEVSSLFPVTSYVTLLFILFLMSFKNPYIANYFRFRKDREVGVSSDRYMRILYNMHKKWPLEGNFVNHRIPIMRKLYYGPARDITFSLMNRPFSYMRMPTNYILTKYYFDADMNSVYLKNPTKAAKMKERNMVNLEMIFKTDVLFYLPRFYYNYYAKLYETNIRSGRAFSRTDKSKLYLDIGLNDEVIATIDSNIKRFFEKKVDIVQILRGDENRQGGLIYNKPDEVEEFLLKSIMVRRPLHLKVNTNQNRTNGIYLLKNGASRFKELLKSEILRFPETEGILDVIKFKDRYIELDYHNKKKKIKFRDVVDFKNRPYLLAPRFMKLVDDIYSKYEIHHTLKYAQIYTRLFNQYGDSMVYFILGVELPEYTGFNYDLFRRRFEKIRNNERERVSKNGFTFHGFEFLFYRVGTNNYMVKKPGNRKFMKLARELYENKIYSKERRDELVDKYCF